MLYMSLWQLLQAHFLTIYSYNKFREEVCQFEKCAAYIKSEYG